MLACALSTFSTHRARCQLPHARKQPRRRQPAPDNASTTSRPASRAKDNERPLVEDIRLLGRILGDVIREQEGVAAYRADRAGAQAVGGVPPRRRPGGRQGAQKPAQGPERRPDRQRDPRLHLFQPPGQSGRRPPPHPPPRHPRARRRHPGRQHRSGAGAPALGRHRAQDHRRHAGAQLCLAGADRPPDRSAAQEHSGRRARHCPAADRARRHQGHGAGRQQPPRTR